MGRIIYHEDRFVYKYFFGEQPSEQMRVPEELGIGRVVREGMDGDTIVIPRAEVVRLKEIYEERGRAIVREHEERLKPFEYTLAERGGTSRIPLLNVQDPGYEKVRMWARKKDVHFWKMIKAFIDYMEAHPEVEEFEFEGEY